MQTPSRLRLRLPHGPVFGAFAPGTLRISGVAVGDDTRQVAFLQWALPQLRLRWPGYRKVRSQVLKRVHRRMQLLGIRDAEEYRRYLQRHPGEWRVLDSLCRITISRFYRDKGVHKLLTDKLLPELATRISGRGHRSLRLWSAGCASGEEPYSLAILWQLQLSAIYPDMDLQLLATDADPHLLQRARVACYPGSSLRELPEPWREQAFVNHDGEYCLRGAFRTAVLFVEHDIRQAAPAADLHLILCRNLVYTYFETALQREITASLHQALQPGGLLVLGSHEHLPRDTSGFMALPRTPGIYRKLPGRQPSSASARTPGEPQRNAEHL